METTSSARLVITFRSTTDALRAEAHLSSLFLPGRLIPLPAGIRADCGMGWMCPVKSREMTLAALSDAGIQVIGIHDHITRS